jgi:hypothetical protein
MAPSTLLPALVCAVCVAPAAAGCGPQLDPTTCGLGNPRSVPLDASTPEGDTAQALLARAAGPWRGTIRWTGTTPPYPALQMTPAAGTTVQIDVAVTSTATAASYRPATALHPRENLTCAGVLNVAAVAHVMTADGGLDEQWTIALDDSGGPDPDGAYFRVDLRQQPVQGTFHVVDPDVASWDKTYLGFDAIFSPTAGASGTVYYGASRMRGDSYEGYSSTIASWTALATAADGAP